MCLEQLEQYIIHALTQANQGLEIVADCGQSKCAENAAHFLRRQKHWARATLRAIEHGLNHDAMLAELETAADKASVAMDRLGESLT